jgi:hypothetical protein
MSTATIPDVCKTPSPAGPVPIPYPNFARQSSLKGGTTTVKAKGEMIAVKGSQYSSSNGDEAGTAGGVKSGVNMKGTDWITYSFDVKMDGQNACRHTDKKFHNNQNTVDLGGNYDPNSPPMGVSPKKWRECIAQHDKYKAVQNKEAAHRTAEYNEIEGRLEREIERRATNPLSPALLTPADRATFNEINAEKSLLLDELIEERQKYIDMGCDDIPWPDSKHADAKARRDAHYGEMNATKKRVKAMRGLVA